MEKISNYNQILTFLAKLHFLENYRSMKKLDILVKCEQSYIYYMVHVFTVR